MADSLNWALNLNYESIIRISIMFLIILPYIYVIYLDLKYREMEYWTILLSSFINILLIFIPVFIWGTTSFGWNLLYILILFMLFSILNGLFNKEGVLGKADVDVFIAQALITGSILLYLYINIDNGAAAFLNISIITEMIFTSIVIGLIATIIIWIFKITIIKIRTKNKIKAIIKQNKEVPTLISFIPWIIVNAYLIMGI